MSMRQCNTMVGSVNPTLPNPLAFPCERKGFGSAATPLTPFARAIGQPAGGPAIGRLCRRGPGRPALSNRHYVGGWNHGRKSGKPDRIFSTPQRDFPRCCPPALPRWPIWPAGDVRVRPRNPSPDKGILLSRQPRTPSLRANPPRIDPDRRRPLPMRAEQQQR
jgi:hypothetical protein